MEDGDGTTANMHCPDIALERILEHCKIGQNQIGLVGNTKVTAKSGNKDLLEFVQAQVEARGGSATVYLNCPTAKLFRLNCLSHWQVSKKANVKPMRKKSTLFLS